MTTTLDYQLQPGDMAAWTHLINLQNVLGPGRPNVDDAGSFQLTEWIQIMTSHEHLAVPHQVSWKKAIITPIYRPGLNSQLKSWFDDVFVALAKFPTNYGPSADMPFCEVYLGYMYSLFIPTYSCSDCLDTDKYYVAFEKGAKSIPRLMYDDCPSWSVGPWQRPEVPVSWRDSINSVFKRWNPKGVPDILQSLGFDLIKTKNWTNADRLKQATDALWTDQAQALSNLKSKKSLSDDECTFLLYLLSSLGTGNSKEQSTVETFVSQVTNSPELPNDTFIDALVYLVLMLWVDPLGKYGWTNTQIRKTLKTLQDVLTGPDKGTKAINTSVVKYQKILKADPSYPMTDPYNPSIGFNTRKADLMGALNAAWSKLAI